MLVVAERVNGERRADMQLAAFKRMSALQRVSSRAPSSPTHPPRMHDDTLHTHTHTHTHGPVSLVAFGQQQGSFLACSSHLRLLLKSLLLSQRSAQSLSYRVKVVGVQYACCVCW